MYFDEMVSMLIKLLPEDLKKAVKSYKEWSSEKRGLIVGVTTHPFLFITVFEKTYSACVEEDFAYINSLLANKYYGSKEAFTKAYQAGHLEMLKTENGPWFMRDLTMKGDHTVNSGQFLN